MSGISKEWFELLSEDAIPRFKGKPNTLSYVEIWTDCPGEHETMWIWYNLQGGIGCVDRGCGFDIHDVPPHDLMICATYDAHKEVIEGKIDPVKGLFSGRVKPMDCTVKTILKNMPLFNLLTESKRSVDWEY